MKCPQCEVWTTVIRTVGALRRRECGNGHRFSTREVVVQDEEKELRLVLIARAVLALRDHGPMSVPRLTALVRAQENTVKNWIDAWAEAGLVERVGVDESARGIKPTLWKIRT